MKLKFFFILFIGLIFCIFSCDRKSDWEGVQELELRFTADDIKSLDTSSGIIVFVEVVYEKILTGDYDRLSFYVDNKPVLEDIIIRWPMDIIPYGFIALAAREGYYNTSIGRNEYSFRLTNQYAGQKFEAEWDNLIKCLRDAGKIVLPPPPAKLTIDDIKSYNVTTFEIGFTDFDPWTFMSISFYFEDKPLLENIQRRGGPLTTTYNDLVIVIGNKSYLADGFPVIMESECDGIGSEYGWDSVTKEKMRKERAENAKKREVEWNLFIRYLTDAGKIVK